MPMQTNTQAHDQHDPYRTHEQEEGSEDGPHHGTGCVVEDGHRRQNDRDHLPQQQLVLLPHGRHGHEGVEDAAHYSHALE